MPACKKPMVLFACDDVLEGRTTIRLLEEKHLAVSVKLEELQDVREIMEKLDKLKSSYSEFYDCADDVAEKLMSL